MDTPVLKLDDLVGRSDPLKVERFGKTYKMTRPEGLTLKQNQEWQEMGKKILLAYGPLAKKNNQEKPSAAESAKAVDDCLQMLCPEILLEEKPLTLGERLKRKLHPSRYEDRRPFTFTEKLMVLQFYYDEALSKKGDQKTEGRKRHSPNSTGA